MSGAYSKDFIKKAREEFAEAGKKKPWVLTFGPFLTFIITAIAYPWILTNFYDFLILALSEWGHDFLKVSPSALNIISMMLYLSLFIFVAMVCIRLSYIFATWRNEVSLLIDVGPYKKILTLVNLFALSSLSLVTVPGYFFQGKTVEESLYLVLGMMSYIIHVSAVTFLFLRMREPFRGILFFTEEDFPLKQ